MRALLATCGSLLALAACSVPPTDSRTTPQAVPDAATFPPVAEMLVVRCGSLDCHGTPGRNLRLYGSAGQRWAATDRPLVPPCDTIDEVDQDYQSVIGLEPEIMGAVVSSGGVSPERLTLVRKARGSEAHKGGTVWTQGDDSDTCLISWLAGGATAAPCAKALTDVLPAGSNALLQCVTAAP
jgi:hypothetical protein